MFSLVRAALYRFLRMGEEDRRSVYASHAAFYVTASALPMLFLLFLILRRISPEGAWRLFSALAGQLPSDMTKALRPELFEGADPLPTWLTSLPVLLWSASKGFGAVSQGLRAVYRRTGRDSPVRRMLRAFAFTAAFAFVLASALAVPVFGETVSAALGGMHEGWFDLFSAVTRLGRIFCFFLFAPVFAAMYKYMAGQGIPLARHLPGAVFSAVGWLLCSFVFSLYLRYVAPLGRFFYGSVGALLLLMVWVRACMSILLIGAEINVWLLSACGEKGTPFPRS